MAHWAALVRSAPLSRSHVRCDLLGLARDGRADMGFYRRARGDNPIHRALVPQWSGFLLDRQLLGRGRCSFWGRSTFRCADSLVSQGARALLAADLRRLVDYLLYTPL